MNFDFNFNYKELCKPARWYFYISIIAIIVLLFQGISLSTLIIKAIIMFFWMWFLNKLCSWGYRNTAWILVLLPIILFLIVIFIMAGITYQYTGKFTTGAVPVSKKCAQHF